MKGYSGLKRAGVFFVLAISLLATGLSLMTGLLPRPVSAQNAVGISGNFYTQKFVIPVGGSVDVESINVVAFNQGTEAATFIVSYTSTSPDVTLKLSTTEFVLDPSERMTVQVGVYVGANANPGMQEITVNVKAQVETTEGKVVPIGAAEEKTSLSIVGEAGNVHVETVSPSGGRVATHIRLWRLVTEGSEVKEYESAESVTGVLDKTVSPGHYRVKAFSMGVELASEEFDVADLEQVSRTFTVETIYFKYFEPTLATNVNTGAPGYAQMVYTIANVYQPVSNAAVNLVVKFEGSDLEMVPGILTLSSLRTDDTGVPYQYFPSAGWEEGTYSFQLELYLGGQLYARSEEKPLDVSLPSPGGRSMAWLWILLVVLGAAGLGFLIFFLLKRRKKEEEKPRKAEKKPKEEKPARKAEEPVRKPEPYRPPEPVRPAPPPPVEEPIVEPAPLASISSLKARMASIGRDQGTAKADEEEPDVEEKDKTVGPSPQARAVGPVPPPARVEPERPAIKKAEEKVVKPSPTVKPSSQKPGIFSKVTANPKQEPPKPPSDVQISWPPKPVEPAKPPKPPSDVQISWPPKHVEPPKLPSDVQINWPPKPVEPPRPPPAQPEAEPAPPAPAPLEAAPTEEAAPEEPAEPEAPPSRSSFAEAARLRMEARQRSSETGKPGAKPEQPQTEGDAGEPGEGEEQPPSP